MTEERDGLWVSYDTANKTATVKDLYTDATLVLDDIGGIGNSNIPLNAAIRYILIYLPPRGAEAAGKIKQILREIKS